MKITPDALAQHLAGQLLPAYLVSGDEPLLTGEAADEIRERARAAGFTEREVHFIERAADWDDVRASGANLSLFGCAPRGRDPHAQRQAGRGRRCGVGRAAEGQGS